MGINLSKGEKISLEKVSPGLKKIMVGLQWDSRVTDGVDFDADVSVFMLGDGGVVKSEQDFIWYKNLEHKSGSVIHTGDNRTGEGDGDDEVINVDLDKVPEEVKELAFVVTIYDAEARSQNFGQISNACIRFVNQDTGSEEVRYDLSEDYSVETALCFAKLYKHNGEWKLTADGQGYEGGLGKFVEMYGLTLA